MSTRLDKNRAKRASANFLATLYAQQNSLCHWCKSQTVLRRFIANEAVIHDTGTRVSWREGEHVFSARIASLDHLSPLRDGRPEMHRFENFVMACVDCNKDRTEMKKVKVERIVQLCEQCLGEERIHRLKLCVTCLRAATEIWLAEHGWLKAMHRDDGTYLWLDPETGRAFIAPRAYRVLQKRVGKPAFREFTS